jgi:hypothetical protein
MPLQTSKPHPGLSDLTRSTDNTDGTTDSTSTDNSTCGTRLMMMLARRGEGREIEEGRDGKGKGEREPETKRKGASAMIGRSIKPLPIFMDILFSIAIYVKPQAFVCSVRVVTPVTAVGPLQWSAPTYGESIGMRRGE